MRSALWGEQRLSTGLIGRSHAPFAAPVGLILARVSGERKGRVVETATAKSDEAELWVSTCFSFLPDKMGDDEAVVSADGPPRRPSPRTRWPLCSPEFLQKNEKEGAHEPMWGGGGAFGWPWAFPEGKKQSRAELHSWLVCEAR